MNFKESETKQNLARSFAAECQAGARYQFMATKAQNEKLVYIKDTMKLLAKNEMAHAKLFYDYIIDKCGKQCEVELAADYPYVDACLETSLQAEAEIEKEEFDKIYPRFAETARKEGFEDIAKSFELVAKVEKSHSEILKKLYKEYTANSLYNYKSKTILRCSNCGHLEYGTSGWKKCPLCSLEQGYIAIDFNDVFSKCVN